MAATGSDQTQRELFTNTSEVECDQDDICPICTLLIYDPVTTICKHTLCQSCMVNWADTSPRYAEAPEVLPPKEYVDPSELSATCPMCRTKTTASSDLERAASLSAKYPELYAQRGSEELLGINPDLQYLNLYIGNKHQMRVIETPETPQLPAWASPSSSSSSREDESTAVDTPTTTEKAHSRHEWTFFVRTSRDEVIHSVYVHLHPAFTPSHHLINNPPFEVRNMGCKGPFCVSATVVLKKGWVWVSSEADNFERKKFLRLHWTLDLGADREWGDIGSMHRHRLKFRPEKPEDRTAAAPAPLHNHDHRNHEHEHDHGRMITWDSSLEEIDDDDEDDEDYNDEDLTAMEEQGDDHDSTMEDAESSDEYDTDYDDDNMSTSDDHSIGEGAMLGSDEDNLHCAEVERRILAEL